MMDDTTFTDGRTVVDILELPRAPTLTIVYHPDREQIGRQAVLRDEARVTVGRGAELFGPQGLQHGSISRRHAELQHQRGCLAVRDLGSRNGTFLNGVPVTHGAVNERDVLCFGRVVTVFQTAPARVQHALDGAIVGISGPIAILSRQIEAVARSSTTVLIQGETGTGKELVARELHRCSGLAGALVAVNCGGLSDGVLHSELFGHARGAFSGAEAARGGLVRAAAGGTLLLDEIGDASATLQSTLLRLLEQREYRPVGSDEVCHTDARFVAATHVPLAQAAAEGRFRKDLHGRVEQVVVEVPPLRERPQDVIPLALHFAAMAGAADVTLSRSLVTALLRHEWLSNVRQLKAVVEQILLENEGASTLQLTEGVRRRLTPSRQAAAAESPPPQAAAPRTSRPDREQLERLVVAERGNIQALAKRLGVARNTLYRWLKEEGVDWGALRDR